MSEGTNERLVRRVRVLSVIVSALVLILVARLYFLQIVHGDMYTDRADHQYVRPQNGVFDRGSIFFTSKDGTRVSAATLASGFFVTINPSMITDATSTYTALANITPLDATSFMEKASNHTDTYEELTHHLSQADADAITALKLTGVSVYKERWRFYPGNDLASRTLGFVAYQGDVLKGTYGLERYYDDTLSKSDENAYVNFFAEVFSDVKDFVFEGGRNSHGDVVTSIEPTVQGYLEGQLKEVSTKWTTRMAGGVVIDPMTGEIIAMGTYPSFDLNAFRDVKDPLLFSNPMVEDVFEMGSIVKALTMASGLDAGVVTANTTYDDKGFIMLNGKKISNYDGKGRGVIPMQQVLDESLNTGAAFVESKLGNKRFADYFLRFGLGEETGIDLPNETHGLVGNLKSPRDVEYATASFGQGIAVTPVEMVRALSVLANGGTLVTPHLAKEIRYDIGTTKKASADKGVQVISPSASNEITRMLVKVVDEALVGGTVKLPHYSIAAKTGTAQIADPTNGGYYSDRYLHSFFGYFPAYAPRFLVFLYVLEPHGVRYASQTLTTPFINTAKFLLSYYAVPPDR